MLLKGVEIRESVSMVDVSVRCVKVDNAVGVPFILVERMHEWLHPSYYNDLRDV